MAPITVLIRQIKEMYTENIEYLSSSSFTFDFELGFEAFRVLLHSHGLDDDGGCFMIITKGDRNLEWQDVRIVANELVSRLPFYTCYFTAPNFTFTMKEIIDQGLLTWEDGGESGPFLTVMRIPHFNKMLRHELNGRGFRAMIASLKSLLPGLHGSKGEPVKQVNKFTLPEDDGFIPDYSKYITSPRAVTFAPRHRTSRRSMADPPVDAWRSRSEIIRNVYVSPPAYTPDEPVSAQITIHAIPGQTLRIVTSSTTGLIIDPYAYANPDEDYSTQSNRTNYRL